MNRYPRDMNPYQINGMQSLNLAHFNDQCQGQFGRPQMAMHSQEGPRRSLRPRMPSPVNAPIPNATSHRSLHPRPPQFLDNQVWRHPQRSFTGQQSQIIRTDGRANFSHPPPINATNMQQDRRNVGAGNPSHSPSIPVLPQWANTSNTLHRPPQMCIPPPHIPGGTVPPFPPPSYPPNLHGMRQDMPWMPTPMPVMTSPFNPIKREENNQDESESDKIFLQDWLAKRNVNRKSDQSRLKVKKIHQFKQDLSSYLKYIDKLQTCKDVLMKFVNTDEESWQEVVKKTQSIKENLEILQSRLFQENGLKEIIDLMKKRKKKRARQRNSRECKAKEKEEKQKRTMLAHQRIDAWRHQIVSEINAKRMVDSLKSDAGQSLTEVRKKISDCMKCLEKVEAVEELRGIRRPTALQRGVFIFGDQDDIFSRRVEKMKSVLTKRLEVYSNEEKTLVVMLEEEQEQMKKEDDRKRKKIMEKEHLQLFGYDVLLECRRYWQQADVNPISLVQIRRLWDVYLVPNTIMGADAIPDGWVSPEPFQNAAWNKYLEKKSV